MDTFFPYHIPRPVSGEMLPLWSRRDDEFAFLKSQIFGCFKCGTVNNVCLHCLDNWRVSSSPSECNEWVKRLIMQFLYFLGITSELELHLLYLVQVALLV